MIKTVEVGRDVGAKAMNSAWLNDWPPLPQFDEL
jgi:hypothetical protein